MMKPPLVIPDYTSRCMGHGGSSQLLRLEVLMHCLSEIRRSSFELILFASLELAAEVSRMLVWSSTCLDDAGEFARALLKHFAVTTRAISGQFKNYVTRRCGHQPGLCDAKFLHSELSRLH